jgi:hypothetical protein
MAGRYSDLCRSPARVAPIAALWPAQDWPGEPESVGKACAEAGAMLNQSICFQLIIPNTTRERLTPRSTAGVRLSRRRVPAVARSATG